MAPVQYNDSRNDDSPNTDREPTDREKTDRESPAKHYRKPDQENRR